MSATGRFNANICYFCNYSLAHCADECKFRNYNENSRGNSGQLACEIYSQTSRRFHSLCTVDEFQQLCWLVLWTVWGGSRGLWCKYAHSCGWRDNHCEFRNGKSQCRSRHGPAECRETGCLFVFGQMRRNFWQSKIRELHSSACRNKRWGYKQRLFPAGNPGSSCFYASKGGFHFFARCQPRLLDGHCIYYEQACVGTWRKVQGLFVENPRHGCGYGDCHAFQLRIL